MKIPGLKVAIVDDHQMFAEALKNVLPVYGLIESIDTFLNGELFLAHIELYKIDVLILDLGIKEGMNGFETLKELKLRKPNIKVLILSMHTQKEYVEKTKNMGASGYMSKESSALDLHYAISFIVKNSEFYCGLEKVENPFNSLSPTESKVAAEILKGKSNREISELFNRSKDAIDSHRKNIYRKLEVNSIVGFIKMGVKYGMITDSIQ